MLYPYQLNIIWSNVSFNACVSLLIFCVNDLCIGISGVLKSKYYCVTVDFVDFSFYGVSMAAYIEVLLRWVCVCVCV